MEKWELTDEEITTIGDAWMREDFAVRTISIGRGHWEEIARAIATAAGEKARRESQSDLTALRAEVEVLRRAVDVAIGLGDYCPPGAPGCRVESEADCLTCKTKWAISEARKGE